MEKLDKTTLEYLKEILSRKSEASNTYGKLLREESDKDINFGKEMAYEDVLDMITELLGNN